MLDPELKEYLEILILPITTKIDFAIEKMGYMIDGMDKKIDCNEKDIDELKKVDGRVKVLEDNKENKKFTIGKILVGIGILASLTIGILSIAL